MISEISVFEAARNKLAMGDRRPISTQDLYDHVAEDMARKDYKQLAVDLLASVNKDHEHAVSSFTKGSHVLEAAEKKGRKLGIEAKARTRERIVRHALEKHIDALDAAITRNGEMLTAFGREVTEHLHDLRGSMVHVHELVAEQRRIGHRPGIEEGAPRDSPSMT